MHIALNPFKAVAMMANQTSWYSTNLLGVSGVEMVSTWRLVVAIEGDGVISLWWEAVPGYPFRPISMPSCDTWSSRTNLVGVCGVEVISPIVVAVQRNATSNQPFPDNTLSALWSITMMPNLPMCCCSNFVDVCCVEMITPIPITIKRSKACVKWMRAPLRLTLFPLLWLPSRLYVRPFFM